MKTQQNFFSMTPLFLILFVFSSLNIFSQALITPEDVSINGVKLEMTQDQVQKLLGKPESKSQEVLGFRWKYVNPALDIYFAKSGKVTLVNTKDSKVKIDVKGKSFKVSSSVSDVKKILGKPYAEDNFGDFTELYYVDQGLTISCNKGSVIRVMFSE